MEEFNFTENHIDQFAFAEKRTDGIKLNLSWFDYIEKNPEPALEEEYEKNITISPNASKLVWSPKGSYLAVCEVNGVTLYGGKNMKKKAFY